MLRDTISLKPSVGNYLGASGPMELGLAVSSINRGEPRLCQPDHLWSPMKGVDLLVNSFDLRGNVTTASATAFRQ